MLLSAHTAAPKIVPQTALIPCRREGLLVSGERSCLQDYCSAFAILAQTQHPRSLA